MTIRRLDLSEILDGCILVLAFLLANWRASAIIHLFPDLTPYTGDAWVEDALWLVVDLLVCVAIARRGLFPEFGAAWKRQWPLILLVAFAGISLAWSVFLPASLYRYIGFLSTTLVAAHFGLRYRIRDWLGVLFWFGAILVILCLAAAVFLPNMGRMLNETYNGAWRGVFWHKNQMGAVLALVNAVFALRTLIDLRERASFAALDGLFYLLSLFLILESRSVGGYLSALFMIGVLLVFWLWLRFRERLRPPHYWLILGGAGLLALVFFANLNALLGLFNRDTSLTGRLPMWGVLLRDYVPQRPLLGYGFGSVWSLESFRVAVQQEVGWGYQVQLADNGFLDILVQLGVVGLGLFLVVYLQMWSRALRYTFSRHTLEDSYPLMLMVFTLVANISFSLFFETETFVWLLMVAALFMVTQQDRADPISAQG